MKIDQLPLGARFQWKGCNYSKVGPMTGAADGGGVVFIPKHAVLKPVPDEAPPALLPDPAAEPLDGAKVLVAFEAYHRTALGLVDDAGRLALEGARRRFLSMLR